MLGTAQKGGGLDTRPIIKYLLTRLSTDNARAERYTSPLECDRRRMIRLPLDPKRRSTAGGESGDIWNSHPSLLYKLFKLDVAHEYPWMENSDHSHATYLLI